MEIYRSMNEILHRKEDSPWQGSNTPLGKKYCPIPELGVGSIEYVGEYDSCIWTFADLVFHKPYICRQIIQERYIEIGQTPAHADGTVIYYQKRNMPLPVNQGLNCFVNTTKLDIFSRIDAHKPFQCCSLVILEKFFEKNHIVLPEDFWNTGARLLNPDILHIPEISAVLHQAGKAYGMRPKSAVLYLEAKAMEIAALLLEYVQMYKGKVPSRIQPEASGKIEKAKAILEDNLKHPPSVTQLAQRIGTNKNRLQAGFRLHTGLTVSGYLRSCRMNKALEILGDSDTAISEVARAVGYQSEANFYKNFKIMFSMSPGQMRQLLTGNCEESCEKQILDSKENTRLGSGLFRP